jgi:hypothetical protein
MEPSKRDERGIKSNEDRNTIVVTWKNEGGFGHGKSNDPLCALARPYRQLFEEGKPVGKVNRLFLKIGETPSFIVGSLCFTPNARILFYPGLVDRLVNWECTNNQLNKVKTRGLIDHITLENDFQNWHFTILDCKGKKRTKLSTRHVRAINNKIIFWFGLTLRNLETLEPTPQELTMSFSTSASDAERRLNEFLQTRERAVPHILQVDLDEDKNTLKNGEFLHLDFFLADSKIDVRTFPCCAPTIPPVVSQYSQINKHGVPIRAHPVTLEGVSEKIWVVVSKHVGLPNEKAIFVCG